MSERRAIATNNERRKHLWIRLSIWSLKRHDRLIVVLRMVMMAFPFMVLLTVFAGKIDLEAALRIIAFGGLAAVVLITGLMLTRRNVLLGIDDPGLRAEAHEAMAALIQKRTAIHSAGQVQQDRNEPTEADRCRQPGECRR